MAQQTNENLNTKVPNQNRQPNSTQEPKKGKPSEFPEIEQQPTADADVQMNPREPVQQKAPGDTI